MDENDHEYLHQSTTTALLALGTFAEEVSKKLVSAIESINSINRSLIKLTEEQKEIKNQLVAILSIVKEIKKPD